MPRSSDESKLSTSFSSVARELENILFPAHQNSRVGVEGELIAIIDNASSSKTEHTSTSGIGGASTGIISTGVITIHHIHIGDGNGTSGGKTDNADDSIFSSSYFSYWGRTTKQTKEDILQRYVVCAKTKRAPKGSRERNIHHAKATKALSQTFGGANQFLPKNSEGESESTKYTDIKSEYIGNLAKIKLLEARIMVYDMRDNFITSTLVDYCS